MEARAEVHECAATCDYYTGHLVEFLADTHIATEARSSFVRYEPLGVVLAVMPWNFPFWQVIRFAVPSLGAGNAGVLKHASNVTGCALALEDLFRRAGFPEHLLTAVVIADHSLVEELVVDPRVAAVTLTGSGGC
jgi:succinate-semialdehyde dehydrogenase / glutarate-semialdehyde dehydrogenase